MMSLTRKLIPVLLSLILMGCGYSIRTKADLPYTSLRIASIMNKTSQPDIEDILYRKLAQEIEKQGIAITGSSAYVMTGEIRNFHLKVVSEKDEFSREYEVLITAEFMITGPEGYKKKLSSVKSPYIESFIAQREINSIIAFKELATERALESLSNRLVTEAIYNKNEKVSERKRKGVSPERLPSPEH